MEWLLRLALQRLVKHGRLSVKTSAGHNQDYGDDTGPRVSIKFTSLRWQLAVILDPELQLGQAYTDGGLVVTSGSIADFLDIILNNLGTRPQTLWTRGIKKIRGLWQSVLLLCDKSRSSSTAKLHYDLSYDIFRSFLDSNLQYSCAYFANEHYTLEQAQQAKIQHIATKLLLKGRNIRVLDIGCGWGTFDLHLATKHRANVLGINVSNEQLAVANALLEQTQCLERELVNCSFLSKDYRDLPEDKKFDRIVSIGMFEHVGKSHYDSFFRKCSNVLEEDGIMVLHTVGRITEPREPNAWVSKHIFPGGYAPALSEVFPAIERSGLRVTDLEVWDRHYIRTLQLWRARFMCNRGEVARILGDNSERFIRAWEFYFAGFEAAFRHGGLVVFQIQLTKNLGVTPRTRNYIGSREMPLEDGYRLVAEGKPSGEEPELAAGVDWR